MRETEITFISGATKTRFLTFSIHHLSTKAILCISLNKPLC